MHNSSEHLLKRIDQIVDDSELDPGKRGSEAQRTSLDELQSEITCRLANEAKNKQLDFQVHCSNQLDRDLAIDRKRILQTISEIGGNAIKFTPKGSVQISLYLEKAADKDRGVLRITINDTGIGIPAKKRAELLDPFTPAETKRNHSRGGHGLSICEEILKSLAGSIHIDSEVGAGTKVTVLIPIATVAPESESAGPRAGKATNVLILPLDILIVEDNLINQEVVVSLLKRMGAKTSCAGNGRIALEMLETQSFDAILMDLSMPDMDGITATQEIRKRPEVADIPIFALTANSYSDAKEKCLKAGMNAFLSKPVNSSKLYASLSKVVPRNPTVSP